MESLNPEISLDTGGKNLRISSGMVSNSLDAGGRFYWMPEGRSSGLVEMLPPGSSDLEVGNFGDSLRQFLMMFGVLR